MITPRVLLITGVPLSVARRVIVLVEGLWVICGVQLNTPLPEWIVAPAGGATRPQVMPWPSASVAVAVKLTLWPAVTVRGAIAAITGALLLPMPVTMLASRGVVFVME